MGVWQQELKYALFKNKIIKIKTTNKQTNHNNKKQTNLEVKSNLTSACAVHVYFYLSSFCPASWMYVLVFGICEERMKNAIPFIKTFFGGNRISYNHILKLPK